MALHSLQLRSTFPGAFPLAPAAAAPVAPPGELLLLLVVRPKNFFDDTFLMDESVVVAAAALGVDGEKQLGDASAFIMGDDLTFKTFFVDLSLFCG